jgi:hypothetical protein
LEQLLTTPLAENAPVQKTATPAKTVNTASTVRKMEEVVGCVSNKDIN